MFSIGRLYGRDINLIAQLNTIIDPTVLRPGTRIFIPPSDFYPSYASAPPMPKNAQPPAQQPRDTARASPSKPEDDILKRAPKLKWEIKPDRASSTVIASARDYGEIDGNGKKTPRSSDKPLFIVPVQGRITRRFSNDKHDLHKGVDIAASEGSKVVAARAGRVIWSRNKMPGYGNLIIIDHGEGFATVYGHNAKNLVHEDQYVHQGETIATVGKTGKASGPHVHFEIRRNTICVDPLDYVR